MKKTVYDTTKLAESIGYYGSLAEAKQVMLENIVGIATAVYDRDTERAMMIQNNLMGAYDIINAIKEKEVNDE